MVRTFVAQAGVTPAGSPVAVPIPVALAVVLVMLDKAVFIQRVGLEEAVPAVFNGVTVIVLLLAGILISIGLVCCVVLPLPN